MSLWSRIERRLQDLADEILPDGFREAVEAARVDLEEGRAEDAAARLDALVAERPSHAGAQALRGAALLELGRLDDGIAAFDRAAELAADRPEPYLGRGEARLRLGDAAAAASDFRRALSSAGGDRAVLAAAYRGLGFAHRLAGDLDKAIRELRKAVAEAPDDAGALAALGDALLADEGGSRGEARRHLHAAAEAPAPPVLTWLALGRLGLAEGDPEAARPWFERAAVAAERDASAVRPPDRPASLAEALLGSGEAALRLGDPAAARERFEAALAAAPDRGDVHARIGEALLAEDRPAEALERFRAALERGGEPVVLRRALDAALAADDLAAAVPLASLVLEGDPGEPRALLARGRALVLGGQLDEAAATFRAALDRDRGPDTCLALAALELSRPGDAEAPAHAARWALGALSAAPDDARARASLRAARDLELAVRPGGAAPDDPSALYELAEEVRRLCLGRPELAHLGGDAARAAADFDQPLLVTVMGEFSSGKSTFVNAFIGEDVAPTGITPTTATINVVKYGRERGGRISYRDGRSETLAWDALFDRLHRLDVDSARQIGLVEILLPLEALARVNLVDTPGLNSILPEHQQVARDFIQRADAVIWLFAAQQAGKASERAALARIRDEGVRALGALNKIDQIDAAERGAITAYVERELDGLVEVVVPLSARRAVESRGDDDAWRAMSRALEERFFAHARDIKRQVLARRLGRILDAAGELVAQERRGAAAAAERRRAGADAARDARAHFFDVVVAAERRRLGEGAALLFRGAAREVLDLVIPRRLPFGSHRASRADRDYLIALLDAGFASLLDQSRRRVDAAIRRAGAEALAAAKAGPPADDAPLAEVERALSDSIHILDAQVYARTLAYLRGYLEGGYVDSFFRRDLPKLELVEDAVYHALFRDSPDLDAAVAVPLAEQGCAALERAAARLRHLAGWSEVRAFDLEVGHGRAIERLAARLAELAP